MTLEEIRQKAIMLHNRKFGTNHCDPRYIMSCREMPNIILNLNKEEACDSSSE
jgi:hypothetical protein